MQVVDAVETRGPAGGANPRRTRAHARARSHSAQVKTLRRLIPVAAGAAVLLLGAATLFNPFGTLAPSVAIGPVSLSGTKVRMENPRLSGFRKNDRGYEVTAAAALQDVRKPSLIELEAMRGHIATDDKGGIARIEAATGLFDTSRESLTLERDIRLWTDKGEEARLKSAAVDFKAGTVTSREAVTVTVPSGAVVADSLDVVDNGKVISFIGNVRTVFNGGDAKADKAEGADRAARIVTSAAEPADGQP
ncbi:lipopolysaccharide-assembly, LptC-related protein [Methylobacterium planeticum]|uniref:Lipopolysaccharide-assembly, LptC-related protein n=1 Tax=Methylobacterium planeticum TaxID=2615211 RepID=A0A6N6MX13_9HYPH|nr:lipopolysaccharide-assembly, LptC-related protein [Methylobacterium planeticum]KAB1075812.1 lipopolysaccharide-assembly, LptC-related protein [Methylobacterium planeticum]